MTARFVPLGQTHVSAAVALARNAYTRECRHVPALATTGVADRLSTAIADLVRDGQGVAALDGEALAGYLAFYGPFGDFFGNGIGAFSPLHGNDATGDHRERLTSLLFQHAAEALTARGANTFAITTWRHDAEMGTALTLNGFGIRCADAIRMVAPPLDVAPAASIAFEEISWQDAGELLPLKNGLVRHLHRGPTFLVGDEFTADTFATLNAKRRSRFFVARAGPTPVGYLELTDDGENVFTTAPDMVNICGAYLDEAYRGHDLYRNLLAFTLATLRTEGVRRIGVDFETMNPTALHFWTKDFTIYTHSYARRIDHLR